MLVTIKDLAGMEGISENALRGWIREHKLPTVRVGARIMIRMGTFEDWLKEHEQVIEPPEKFKPPESSYEPKSRAAQKMKKIY
ncbi:MAG: helix-turn-helix domain-containing protein [Acidaminococcales bacterium]|jgi:hypothetical protein|nr:helix-turn-helix domain-containing protein [Acidaminococcales bacterium]